MARHSGPRLVQCYLCGHRFEVGGRAQSTSCPGCYKPVQVGDVVVSGQRGPIRELRTCGRVTIKKRGRLMAESIEAHGGIDCQGVVTARRVLSGKTVELGAKSQWQGDLTAPNVAMKLGARVLGMFEVPADPRGLGDLP